MSPPRRRLAALIATAVAALTAGVIAGAGDDGGRSGPARRPHGATAPGAAVDRLSLRQQVGQVLVTAFAGTTPPPYMDRLLREGEVAGAILFGENAPSAPAVRALTARLQRAARGGALIATDQEGGDVRILRFAGPGLAQRATTTPAGAAGQARTGARGLRAVGVNVTLAPVADVARGGALAGRAFPGDPAGPVTAAVRAWLSGRVAPTAKHFPGLGGAKANTDDQGVRIPGRSAADLVPFRAAIRAGVPLVMVSHALYPAYDRTRIASQSGTIIDGLLRGRLGFRGVVITDSIEAQAVLSRSSVEEGAERSLQAGADIVLMTGSGSYKSVYPRLLRDARRSPRLRARIRRAAARVLALKKRLGLSSPNP